MPVKPSEKKRPIESYEHKGKQRVNNPPVGLVTPDTDPELGARKTYAYDPHLDPQLQWAGKAEHTSFEVPTVSLHVHERIDPRTIIEAVRSRPARGAGPVQLPLFATTQENPPLREAIEFYQHPHGWSNRLIAGDSLLVMNSLMEKEGLAGKVQMIYLDPPYGITYGSNFQPFVNKRIVKDGKDEDLTQEPEMIKAFRDTWELDIHSYITYLRDRLLLARDLLTETGSIFIQISDQNVHLVRILLDEVFGVQNFASLITFRTATSQPSNLIASVSDYLVWYCKDKKKAKYNQIFRDRLFFEKVKTFGFLETQDGIVRALNARERNGIDPLPGGRLFKDSDITSTLGNEEIPKPLFFQDNEWSPPSGRKWTDGIELLKRENRIAAIGNSLVGKRYEEDFPVVNLPIFGTIQFKEPLNLQGTLRNMLFKQILK